MSGKSQKAMDAARAADEQLAKELPGGARIGRTGRHTLRIGPEALDQAIATEGPEVVTEAATEYWDDMRRRYPHIDPQRHNGSTTGNVRSSSLNGKRNRFGRVKEKIVYRNGRRIVLVGSGA